MDHHIHNWVMVVMMGGLCIEICRHIISMVRQDREHRARLAGMGNTSPPRLRTGLMVNFLGAVVGFAAFIALAHAWSDIIGIRLSIHTWAGPIFLKVLGILFLYILFAGLLFIVNVKRLQKRAMMSVQASFQTARRQLELEHCNMTEEQYALAEQIISRSESRLSRIQKGRITPDELQHEATAVNDLREQFLKKEREH